MNSDKLVKGSILVVSSLCFLLSSCASHERVVSETSPSRDFYCGSYNRKNYENPEYERTYQAESLIGLELVIKNGDTLEIAELSCVDSILFTKTLAEFEVSEMCIEMGIQGKTYFRAKTNKYGGFEEVNVARSVDGCLRRFEENILQSVLKMRIVPENAGTYEIVFFHYLRLH